MHQDLMTVCVRLAGIVILAALQSRTGNVGANSDIPSQDKRGAGEWGLPITYDFEILGVHALVEVRALLRRVGVGAGVAQRGEHTPDRADAHDERPHLRVEIAALLLGQDVANESETNLGPGSILARVGKKAAQTADRTRHSSAQYQPCFMVARCTSERLRHCEGLRMRTTNQSGGMMLSHATKASLCFKQARRSQAPRAPAQPHRQAMRNH